MSNFDRKAARARWNAYAQALDDARHYAGGRPLRVPVECMADMRQALDMLDEMERLLQGWVDPTRVGKLRDVLDGPTTTPDAGDQEASDGE